MSQIFGHLNISDSEYVMSGAVGQEVLWDSAQAYLAKVNAEVARVMSLFVEETTEKYKRRYALPAGGGYLQRRNSDGTYGAVKATGSWDVAFPLEDFGAQLATNDVDMRYMTIGDLDRWMQTVVIQDVNTVRHHILKALLNNAADTFVDPIWGSLSIQPLANGDSVVYPPVDGSEAEATENHYLESNYASASISDSNNPFVTIVDDLIHHFGIDMLGANVATLINSAERAKVEALTEFEEVPDRYIRPGDDTAVLTSVPANLPGNVIGRVSGSWVSVWNWIPANYMLGIYMDAPKPLVQRIDPAETGLGSGLQLIQQYDEFPFQGSFWRHRFGLGAGNRLNGVVMELGTGGTYTVPTGY